MAGACRSAAASSSRRRPIWSSGVGASVGLEAGYTQLVSGVASWIGRAFRLRRNDLRLLVGCGAAGAIAGAFGAPLAGAFYAFELIIGSYTAASLAPVGIAALIGYLVAQRFAPLIARHRSPATIGDVAGRDLAIAACSASLAPRLGIVLMRGVALCRGRCSSAEPASAAVAPGARRRSSSARWRCVTPQVLSSGHGALHLTATHADDAAHAVGYAFRAEDRSPRSSRSARASAAGCSSPRCCSARSAGGCSPRRSTASGPRCTLDPTSTPILGMGALSASVIGGPLTMTFIALETTGDLWLTTRC